MTCDLCDIGKIFLKYNYCERSKLSKCDNRLNQNSKSNCLKFSAVEFLVILVWKSRSSDNVQSRCNFLHRHKLSSRCSTPIIICALWRHQKLTSEITQPSSKQNRKFDHFPISFMLWSMERGIPGKTDMQSKRQQTRKSVSQHNTVFENDTKCLISIF